MQLHRANERLASKLGWLESFHSFSFGQHHDPERMGFGALRVINDDRVAGGAGFPTHPHRNMEIVSIPLVGSLEHQDSTGNAYKIIAGDVQVMSAGHGIAHSEYNGSATEDVNFLQIWVIPAVMNTAPGYRQHTFTDQDYEQKFATIVKPQGSEGAGVEIGQEAYFDRGRFALGTKLHKQRRSDRSGLYLFLIEGEALVNGQRLGRRDAIGLEGDLEIETTADADILVIEVPIF